MKKNKDSDIHIALSPWDLTDSYNRHAGATLVSLIKNCSKPVFIHILYDHNLSYGKEKETVYNMSCYQKIADKYDVNIQFHHVDLPSWISDMPSVSHWTPGTLLRLCLPELLPEIDKILYLDCDIIVLTDTSKLWDYDISDYYLAACSEDLHKEFSKRNGRFTYYRQNNIPIDSYFNAGFILMNLKKLRESDFSQKIFDFMHSHLDLPSLDQDALNWFCQGKYLQLDKKYDVMVWLDNPLNYNGDCNIHYSGKPWKYYHGIIDDYYWDYLKETPWCENQEEYLKYRQEVSNISKIPPIILNNPLIHTISPYIVKILNKCRLK